MDRRPLLAATLAVLVGCVGRPTGSGPPADQTATPTPTPTPTGTATDAPSAGRPDLREANVTAVDVEATGDGGGGGTDYRFDVTLYHDDAGEDGYADRWVVETRDGRELGRRELLHAHGTREFTRSATVTVPDDVACVVVRGHDQTHGYGGQAMVVTPATGATRPLEQGPDRRSFADEACP
jgi:hypothetical protein